MRPAAAFFRPVSPLELVANATEAAKRTLGVLARGESPVAPAAESEGRFEVCRACEFYRAERCLKCGCFLRVKTYLRAEHCPVGKW